MNTLGADAAILNPRVLVLSLVASQVPSQVPSQFPAWHHRHRWRTAHQLGPEMRRGWHHHPSTQVFAEHRVPPNSAHRAVQGVKDRRFT